MQDFSDPVTNTYNVLPDEFASIYKEMLQYGVHTIGGCCGTTPEYIKKLKQMAEEANENGEFVRGSMKRQLSVCSPTKTVIVDQPRIVGERINPTGKKRFKQALMENDMDYILGQAIEQIEAGG